MTTNIGLVTSDAVVLGCDSIASASTHYLNPFAMKWERDSAGNIVKDANGKWSVKFDYDDLESVVTDAWGGVQKLFQIHPDPSPVMAVTAGLAKMNERPIASWADDFFRQHKARKAKRLVDCTVIVKQFLAFMRARYNEHYKDVEIPEILRDELSFLVAGYGRDKQLPQIYRVKVKANSVVEEFGATASDGRTGVLWNAQADAVERFIRGYDTELRESLEADIKKYLKEHSDAVNTLFTNTVNSILAKLNQSMPEGIEIGTPTTPPLQLDWKRQRISISYANLPIQEAVNFVAFLVNLQGGRSRFGRGVATVGGRTHIGIITKDKGFQVLNEPELIHRYTGFSDDH